MAKTLAALKTPTAVAFDWAVTLGKINFGADWKVKSNTPSEVIMINMLSAPDRPEKIRFSFSEVANVYQGTDIDPSAYAPSKRGVSILVQYTATYSVTDAAVPEYRVDLPVSAHTVIKLPYHELITDVEFKTLVLQLTGAMFGTPNAGNITKFAALLRGSLNPNG